MPRCVEFDVASMAPTYRVLWGIPGRSNALAIAERLGLQGAVVEDARSLLSDESDASVEAVVGALQKQREEQRLLNEDLVRARREVSGGAGRGRSGRRRRCAVEGVDARRQHA